MNTLAQPGAAPVHTVLAVPAMHCAGCMGKVERGLAALPGVSEARVNLSARTVAVTHAPELDEPELVAYACLPDHLVERLGPQGRLDRALVAVGVRVGQRPLGEVGQLGGLEVGLVHPLRPC